MAPETESAVHRQQTGDQRMRVKEGGKALAGAIEAKPTSHGVPPWAHIEAVRRGLRGRVQELQAEQQAVTQN